MNIEWISVEIIAVLVENLAYIYFLNSHYISKDTLQRPQFAVWSVLVCWGLTATFLELPVYDLVSHVIMLIYLILCKHGSFVLKLFGVMMVWAIMLGTSVAGAGIASFITSTTIEHTLVYQDIARLLAIIYIKMIQVVVFYMLSKRHHQVRNLQKRPMLILSGAAMIDFTLLIMIRAYIETPNLSIYQIHILIWLAIGSLMVMITIFLMYELFIREELKNVDLAMKLQRLELETQFFKEIDIMYTDMRTWRHEYKNNLTALSALIKHGEIEKSLNYIDNIAYETTKNHITLQTGNLVLDSVVSSKLWLANSQGIEISIQAVYPENNRIDDNDLCAIAGNLLDNAIEACCRMDEKSEKRFIHFTILLKGKNLVISISNSYSGELRREGERYLTIKKDRYHEMGIPHVDSIVNKYNGHVLRTHKHGIFETHVMLPLLSPVGEE